MPSLEKLEQQARIVAGQNPEGHTVAKHPVRNAAEWGFMADVLAELRTVLAAHRGLIDEAAGRVEDADKAFAELDKELESPMSLGEWVAETRESVSLAYRHERRYPDLCSMTAHIGVVDEFDIALELIWLLREEAYDNRQRPDTPDDVTRHLDLLLAQARANVEARS